MTAPATMQLQIHPEIHPELSEPHFPTLAELRAETQRLNIQFFHTSVEHAWAMWQLLELEIQNQFEPEAKPGLKANAFTVHSPRAFECLRRGAVAAYQAAARRAARLRLNEQGFLEAAEDFRRLDILRDCFADVSVDAWSPIPHIVPMEWTPAAPPQQQQQQQRPQELLTVRELEVLCCIAEGQSSKEIAFRLGMSFKTACCHRYRIMEKLGIHDVANLVRYAIRERLITP